MPDDPLQTAWEKRLKELLPDVTFPEGAYSPDEFAELFKQYGVVCPAQTLVERIDVEQFDHWYSDYYLKFVFQNNCAMQLFIGFTRDHMKLRGITDPRETEYVKHSPQRGIKESLNKPTTDDPIYLELYEYVDPAEDHTEKHPSFALRQKSSGNIRDFRSWTNQQDSKCTAR